MYIWVAFGLEGGNQSSGAGWWLKKKCWRSGPNLPRGSGMVQAWVDQKCIDKRDILRLFSMSKGTIFLNQFRLNDMQ